MSGNTYNGETDFLKWYKANYGEEYNPENNFVRGQNMSDAVWNAGQELYSRYTQGINNTQKRDETISDTKEYYKKQKNSLLQNYSTNINALDESKRRAQESASITLDKLKKYLPTQMKMQGLGGLGVSESSAVQAYNNYMNEMGDISANYDTNKTSLATEKTKTENELENYRSDALRKINAEYDGYERTLQEEGGKAALEAYLRGVETEQENNFLAGKTYIESYSDTDAEALEKYLTDTFGEKVSASQLENLKALGRSQVAKNVENANEKAADEKDLVLEYTIIPQLDEYEANGEWDKALTYLEDNKDNFTNQREYEAKHNFITDKIAQKVKEDETKINEEAIILGKSGFYKTGDDKHMYFIDTSRNHDNKYITQSKEFKEALNAKGLSDNSNIPNGTTLEYKIKTSAMGSGTIYMPMCVSYFNGKWYYSYKQELPEDKGNTSNKTSSAVAASQGTTSNGLLGKSNLKYYLK